MNFLASECSADYESYLNYDNGHFYPSLKGTALLNNGANYRQKKKEHSRQPRHRQDQELPPFLDDTASSPAFNFSKCFKIETLYTEELAYRITTLVEQVATLPACDGKLVQR
ncbi:hypothetical protein D5086_002572 [Populus alba]|uniref:Uncharacterized protein n=1 Tax=Populus alba TaxID=43335 RepID=A0ACC4D1W0_POPAL